MTSNLPRHIKEMFKQKIHAEMVYLCSMRIEDAVVTSV